MNEDVLVVDDSLTVRMDIAHALERGGLKARVCSTASEARVALAQASYPVVVLDVVLPDGDGIELLREIRQRESGDRTAVVLLSTEAEVRDRILGMTTGADEYIGKPYEAAYVVARTRELVRERRASPTHDRATVLLVEDSITFRAALGEALTEAGYHVLTAGTGEEGLRVAADRRPDLIVVDGELPGIDGPTVIQRLKLDAALRSTPCLLLTASEEPDFELRALASGADAFLRKDAHPAVVLTRIAVALRSGGDRTSSPGRTSLLGPKKILAVDDSPTYLHELAAALRGEEYDVIVARSGEAALELLEVQPVDCVLLDLAMPGLGGTGTCQRIRATPTLRETPVVVLTAREDRDAMLQAFEVGADDVMPKSVDLAVLRARVEAQIRRRQLEDEERRVRDALVARELQAAEARAARELAETRAALLEDVERKNQELEAFAYSVSHDLRAPLRAIDGFSRALLEDHGDEMVPEARAHAERVVAAAARMDRLIEDLLRLSRIGSAPLHRTRVSLSRMAREVLAELRRAEPSRAVELDIEEGLVVDADPGLLRIVLDNLLGNAWKFTSRADAPRIAVASVPGHEPPAFVVADNGAGFDMAHASRLFAPFQRLHGAAAFPGTGIGLATVRRAIDRHGGRVWAEGQIGAGARFTFTLQGRTSRATPGSDRPPGDAH